MKFTPIEPPRSFNVGPGGHIILQDCARLELQPGERCEVKNSASSAFAVARTEWGWLGEFSLDESLPASGLRAFIAGENRDKLHLLFVSEKKLRAFENYLADEGMEIFARVDGSAIALEVQS